MTKLKIAGMALATILFVGAVSSCKSDNDVLGGG